MEATSGAIAVYIGELDMKIITTRRLWWAIRDTGYLRGGILRSAKSHGQP